LAVDAVTVFLASSIVGIVHVTNANSNESHVDVLADWNSRGPVSLPFLVLSKPEVLLPASREFKESNHNVLLVFVIKEIWDHGLLK